MTDNAIHGLNRLLADYHVIYQKSRNYHWNVTGELFFELHTRFEELYLVLATRIDEIAERILALGGKPAASMGAYLELARLSEERETRDAREMVAQLVEDMRAINGELKRAILDAEERHDRVTANVLDAMHDEQAKTIWMFNAFLS